MKIPERISTPHSKVIVKDKTSYRQLDQLLKVWVVLAQPPE